jgi:hypothetical protein
MSNPKNKPSREPTCEPTNDPMVNDQTTNQRLEWDAELPNILSPKRGKYSLSQKQDAELPSKIAISITQITSNTSYTFEAVNGVNHDHDKIKVDNRVTFENNRDDEIQCGSREQSKTHPSDWHGSKQQSFILSARVPFVTFRSNLSSGFDCWVHSHTGCEPVTSTRGLCHGKKSERAGCIASAQIRGLCHGKKSERAGCIASAQMRGLCHDKTSEPAGCIASAQIQTPPKELQAGLGLRLAKPNGLVSHNLAFGRKELIELIMAFGHNEIIEFTLAFGRNYKELMEPNDISTSNKLILVVASVVWLQNATSSARVNHSSSNKCASGFNCQFIVKSNFEEAQAHNVAPDSISRRRRRCRCRRLHHRHHRRRRCCHRRHIRRSALIVMSVDSTIFHHICDDCRIFREGEWEWDVKDDGEAVVKRQTANENYNWDSCRSVKAGTKAISETRSIASKSKNALPFSGKSKTSFDCTSASTFRLVVAYVDWISHADSTLNLPPDRTIESSLASSKLSRLLYATSAVLASSAESATNGLVEHDGKIHPDGPASKLIVIRNWTKISLIFREDCTIFCEGEWPPTTTKTHGVTIKLASATKITNAAIWYYCAALLSVLLSLIRRESGCGVCGEYFSSLAGLDSVFLNALQNAKQLFSLRLPQMTKYCVMRECDNIHSWISLSGDLAFSHQDGIYGFKFPKRFLEISSRDLTSSSSSFLFCQS